MDEKKKIKESGQMTGGAVVAVIGMIVGIAISVLMLIFSGALAGQTWELVEADVDSITNTTIKDSIKSAVISGFEGLEQTGKYLPLFVLAMFTALIITVVLGFASFQGGAARGGSVL